MHDPLSINRQVQGEFERAWADRDINRLLATLTEDVVYGASVGPEPGATYRGREAVRAGILRMFDLDNAVSTEIEAAIFVGDDAFVQWLYHLPTVPGQPRVARGIDRFQFRDGLICRKEAYRKLFTPTLP